MPDIQTKCEPQAELTIHTVNGAVTLEEFFDCVRRYNESGPTRSTLWDFRNGTIETPPADTVTARTRQSAQLIPAERSGKVALVVEGNLEFGVLQIWTTYSESVSDRLKLRLFQSYDNAIAWLEE